VLSSSSCWNIFQKSCEGRHVCGKVSGARVMCREKASSMNLNGIPAVIRGHFPCIRAGSGHEQC